MRRWSPTTTSGSTGRFPPSRPPICAWPSWKTSASRNSGLPAWRGSPSRPASRARLRAKIAGGAKMFATVSNSSIANIGQRNVAAVKEALRGLGIPILAEDTGRDYGRTLFFSAEDGSMRIKSAKHGERVW